MTRTIHRTISMPCQTGFLQEVRSLIKRSLADAGVSGKKADWIILAVDEAVSSIVRYANYKGYDHDVSLDVDVDDVRFKAVVHDSLNVFDLNGGLTGDALTERVARERSFTLGIFLIRQIMDEISYSYKKGFENTLEMICFL